MSEAKRVPVDFLYHLLNWDFIKEMARIAAYAHSKYGSVQQYTDSRLNGEKSPVNHMVEHIRQYQCNEPHDKLGTVEMQLAAIAYNAMMEYYYYKAHGPEEYKLHVQASKTICVCDMLQRDNSAIRWICPTHGEVESK